MPGKDNAHLWLAEPLMLDPSYMGRRMFGCEACYLNGLMVLVMADSEQPWDGILVPTERQHHPQLMKQFPALLSHPVLGKWLYLSAERDDFEMVARALVRAIKMGHPLVGVEPSRKKRKRKGGVKPQAKPRQTRMVGR